MAKENNDKAIALGNMKRKSGDINVEFQSNEATESNMYQRKMEPSIVDEEKIEKLEESNDSSIEEEGDCLRGDNDIKENILIPKTLVGSNHKFNVHSRYLSDSVGSCHDLCKNGHKHRSENRTRELTPRTIRESKALVKSVGDDLQKCVLEKVTKKKELRRPLSLPSLIPEKAPLRHLEVKNLPTMDINQSKMKRVESERISSLVQSPKTRSGSKTSTQDVKKRVSQSQNLLKTSTQKLKEVMIRKVVGSCSKGEMGIEVKEQISNSPKTPVKKSPSIEVILYKKHNSSSISENQISPGKRVIDGNDCTIQSSVKVELEEKTSSATISGENSQHSPQETRGGKPQGFFITPREKAMPRSSMPKEKSTMEQKWKPKKKEKSNVEGENASTWKVKFKRGTVVALQDANDDPKRLRFRERTLDGDQITKNEINLKLKKVHDISDETQDEIETEKFHLRHQDASEKKDDVDLNVMIEETASKLVKIRKSKVKALVAAFETVMSLGDHKLLVETCAS